MKIKIREIIAPLLQLVFRLKKISVSGELCIGFVTPADICLADLQKILTPLIHKFKKDFPFLKIEMQADLYELTVKIFAYRKNLFDRGFLPLLDDHLKILLYEVYQTSNTKARLNVSGELQSFKSIEKFRYLNSHNQIYSQTEQIQLSNPFSNLKRRI